MRVVSAPSPTVLCFQRGRKFGKRIAPLHHLPHRLALEMRCVDLMASPPSCIWDLVTQLVTVGMTQVPKAFQATFSSSPDPPLRSRRESRSDPRVRRGARRCRGSA
jgi:hypothetical protein